MLVSANFRRLVLSCIEADFCNQILILQHFSRSTRFAIFRTAPISIFLLFSPAHRAKDLTRKQEKVGPFECDVLEKQSRVSARCYPLTVHILHNDKRKRTQKNTLLSQLYPPIRHAKRQNAVPCCFLSFLCVFVVRPMNACDMKRKLYLR